MTTARMGQLRQVFNSKIKFSTRNSYKTAICSFITTYGCEAWNLDIAMMASLNGINARCLSRITGISAHEAASAHTRTYDLVQGKEVEMAWTHFAYAGGTIGQDGSTQAVAARH